METSLFSPPSQTDSSNTTDTTDAHRARLRADVVPSLVAQVFDESPLALRGLLLEHLLKPLGLLSLVAVANGVFARITLGQGWQQVGIGSDDTQRISALEVAALVQHVQQVSVQAMDNLASLIDASPVLAGSAAAAMLLTVLRKQSHNRPPVLGNDFDPLV